MVGRTNIVTRFREKGVGKEMESRKEKEKEYGNGKRRSMETYKRHSTSVTVQPRLGLNHQSIFLCMMNL